MRDVLFSLLAGLASSLRTRVSLRLEILALPTPTRSSPKNRAPATTACHLRPVLVGGPLSRLEQLAQGARDRQARNGHRVAPKRIPVLLELEEPTPHWSTWYPEKDPRVDPRCALGSAETARGI